MNARKYGMTNFPILIPAYDVAEIGMRGKQKKNPVRPRAVGCHRCGAMGVTLRWNKSKTRKVCPKCYERGNE